MQNSNENTINASKIENKKIMNPLEISKLKKRRCKHYTYTKESEC